MRRLLFFLACATVGLGLLIFLSAGSGSGAPIGLAICVLLVLGGALGGRWGRGPVAREVSSPQLAKAGLSIVLLCALAGVLLLWRPAVGKDLPAGYFLLLMAIGGILLIPVGLMGQRPDRPDSHTSDSAA